MNLPTHADVLDARARLAGHIVRTPMLRHRLLDERAGGTVVIKPESLQRTGSFKLRGATNALRRLDAEQRSRGVVTYSSGNHGQAIASAAAAVGMHATVFMPADAPRIKVESTRRWGAEIIHFDRLVADREILARDHASRTGALVVPPFDHNDVIAGQGTLALELADDAAEAGLALDSLLVCTGGGGLIAGCVLALQGTPTRIFAVEPAGWDDTARSLAAGERLPVIPGGSTFCDALLSNMPGEITFAINRPGLSGALLVTDVEVLAAIRFAFDHLKLVVEPGGAVALAALLAGHFEANGQTVGIVISGGNVDPANFARALL